MRINLLYKQLLTVLLLPIIACQKEDIQDVYNLDSEYLIAFSPSIEGEWGDTRATVLTISNLESFGVSASSYTLGDYSSAPCGGYFYKQQVKTSIPYCGKQWLGNAYTLSFFGYAPYSNLMGIQSSETLGRPIYTYTVPSDVASQIDLMTAETLEVAGGNKNTPVPLTFHHRLSDIRFDIYNEGPQIMTVHNIALYGLKYAGTLNGDTWETTGAVNSPSANPFKLDLEDTSDPDDGIAISSLTTSDELTGSTNHFMMIPQTVPQGTSIFYVDATIKGRRAVFHYTLDANLTLQAGKTYHITLSMGYDDIKIKTLSVTDWTKDPASEEPTPPNQRNVSRMGAGSDINDWNIDSDDTGATPPNQRTPASVGASSGVSDWAFGADSSGGINAREAGNIQASINTWSDVHIPKAGDIVLYAGGSVMAVPYQDWNTTSYPTATYTPIGVVIVPGNHTTDKTTRVMSLKNMSAGNPENGSVSSGDVADIQLYWGGDGYDISTLNNYSEAPIWTQSGNSIRNEYNDGDDGENYRYNVYIPTNYTEYSEIANGLESPTDIGSRYYRQSLIDNPEEYAPSIYITDGRRNPMIGGNNASNLFTDMDGYGNTQKILAVDNAGSTEWQTASSIENTNSDEHTHPAAQACWRYTTPGVAAHDWYLPSIGELAYLAARYKDINAALSKIMDTNPTLAVRMFNEALDGAYNNYAYGDLYKSSTERSATKFYPIRPQIGLISMWYSKEELYMEYSRVRAVTKMNL